MKLRASQSTLLLLVLPSLTKALSSPDTTQPDDKTGATLYGAKVDDTAAAVGLGGRQDIPTKDAPVDGQDGKPHSGPFVGSEAAADSDHPALPPLKGRPDDPTMVDGKKIPNSNDGVMFDKNRDRPQEGMTGTTGGVSEKDKARKAHESKTGEKLVTQPESPKEHPPIPHSEQEKIDKVSKSQNPSKQASTDKADGSDKGDKDSDISYTGLDKPDNLPDRTYDNTPKEKLKQGPPVSINDKTPPDRSALSQPTQGGAAAAEEEEEGIIQPFHSFVLSLTMILVSEVGDKTFLVAALMAMKHDRMVVFSAAFGALTVMTVVSAVLGHALPTLIPKKMTSLLAAALFFMFGAKMLREGLKMDPNEGVSAEMYEVEKELAQKEKQLGRESGVAVSDQALEMGLEGRGSRARGRFTPPRSPSQSPVRSPPRLSSMGTLVQGIGNLFSLLLSPAWVQTFVMTFLGEWGDRSQIATIAMAAGQDYWWVTLGAILGHAICTSVAVIGGRAIAGRVSLRVVTMGGATAFLIFGLIYLLEARYA